MRMHSRGMPRDTMMSVCSALLMNRHIDIRSLHKRVLRSKPDGASVTDRSGVVPYNKPSLTPLYMILLRNNQAIRMHPYSIECTGSPSLQLAKRLTSDAIIIYKARYSQILSKTLSIHRMNGCLSDVRRVNCRRRRCTKRRNVTQCRFEGGKAL